MLDFSNGAGVLLFAQVEAPDSDDSVFQEALVRDCQDVVRAINDPTRSELDHIDSVAWVFAGETRGMIQVDWRDKSIAVELRATAFAVAQMAAL